MAEGHALIREAHQYIQQAADAVLRELPRTDERLLVFTRFGTDLTVSGFRMTPAQRVALATLLVQGLQHQVVTERDITERAQALAPTLAPPPAAVPSPAVTTTQVAPNVTRETPTSPRYQDLDERRRPRPEAPDPTDC